MGFSIHETEGVFPLTRAPSISLETKVVCSTLPSGLDMKLAYPLQAIATSVSFPIIIKRNEGYGCAVCVYLYIYIEIHPYIHTCICMCVCI